MLVGVVITLLPVVIIVMKLIMKIVDEREMRTESRASVIRGTASEKKKRKRNNNEDERSRCNTKSVKIDSIVIRHKMRFFVRLRTNRRKEENGHNI